MKTIFSLVVAIVLCIPFVLAIDVTVNTYDPQPAEAGKFVNVWFKVDNPTSIKSDDLFLEINPKDGLALSPGEQNKKKVGILGAFSSQVVQFRLRVQDDAIEGANFVEAIVTSDKTGELSFDLPIEVEEKELEEVDLEVGEIRSDPTRIKPDDDFVKLEVVIQNLGETDAKGVRATLKDLPKGITFSESYSNLELLGNIEADGSKTATFFVDVDEDVKPGDNNAKLDLSYKYKPDEDEDEFVKDQVTLPVRISVKAIPLYEITEIAQSHEFLRAGDQAVKLRLTIQNVGEEEGESVRLKVYGKSEQPFDYEVSSTFVAPSLKPGESGQATLEFDIDDDAALQDYILDVEIKNVIGEDVVTYAKTVPITIDLPRERRGWQILVAGVVIAVIVGLVLLRRKKKKRKKGTARKIKLE